MKRLFLTSSLEGSADFLKQVLPLSTKKHSVAYIANAADLEKDISWTQATQDKLKELNFEIVPIDLRQIQYEELLQALSQLDAVYVEGGHNVYLLEISNKSGFTGIARDLVLNHDKLYMGTSAGSILAGPSVESTMILDDPYKTDLTSYDALGLVEFAVIPHVGGEFNLSKPKEYLQMYSELANYPYPHICLRDNQAVWVEDDKIQIVSL